MEQSVLHNALFGLGVALEPVNLLYCIFGVVAGTILGVIPGIGVLTRHFHALSAYLWPGPHRGHSHAGRDILRHHLRRLHLVHPAQRSGHPGQRHRLLGGQPHGQAGAGRGGALDDHRGLLCGRHLRHSPAHDRRPYPGPVRPEIRRAGVFLHHASWA